MGIPICGACRRPIEERVVTALGKELLLSHPENFAVRFLRAGFP